MRCDERRLSSWWRRCSRHLSATLACHLNGSDVRRQEVNAVQVRHSEADTSATAVRVCC